MAPSATTITEQHASIDTHRESLEHHHRNQHGKEVGKQIMKDTMIKRINGIDLRTCNIGEDDAFFVADMGEVYRQHLRWKMNLRRVKPHFAVKCHPDPQVLRLLAGLGTGFDCASPAEINTILSLGVDPSRIIYANPCKANSALRFAYSQGVKQLVFDNADELIEIKSCAPEAELFLRIVTDDSSSACHLSQKFGTSLDNTGASLETTKDLLAQAKDLNLNVVGVSFHVGSGAQDPGSFTAAVQDSRKVFDQAAELGYNLKTLDVGGGFSGDSFEAMANVLSKALDEHFPPGVRIIGEPGRYYVASAFSLACHIISRRPIRDPETGDTSYRLYVNDGVYGNFSGTIYDHQIVQPCILSEVDRNTRNTRYSVWGHSCDGIDLISETCHLPGILHRGDWLYFDEMGAYSKVSASGFNGFPSHHQVLYVSSEPGASALLKM